MGLGGPPSAQGGPAGTDGATADGGWQATVTQSNPNAPSASTLQARRIMSQIAGFEIQHLDANDLAQVMTTARASITETAQASAQVLSGRAFIAGTARPDPYSQHDRNAVDAAVR